MSNMSELDARINEAIEKDAGGDVTTFDLDESRTAHANGSVTYAYPIMEEFYPPAPRWAMFVGYTYRDGVLLHGPDFAEFRSDLMGGRS